MDRWIRGEATSNKNDLVQKGLKTERASKATAGRALYNKMEQSLKEQYSVMLFTFTNYPYSDYKEQKGKFTWTI